MKRILVVDDNAQYSALLAYMLREQGYKVDVAESGADALILLGDKKFDAAVVDHWMNKMDGIDTVAEMRKRGYRLGVVLLTAMVPAEVESRIEGLEIWSIVEKMKVNEARLLEVIEEAVEFTSMRLPATPQDQI